jgi:hypothetical protein
MENAFLEHPRQVGIPRAGGLLENESARDTTWDQQHAPTWGRRFRLPMSFSAAMANQPRVVR